MIFTMNQSGVPYESFEMMKQTSHKSNENNQRSRFSKEEDELLKLLVNTGSQPKWSEIASRFTNRTARQCRERYNNYLRPELINGPWTIEEEKLLLELYERYGPKWSFISQSFESRSSVNVKNHYSSLVSQKSPKSPKKSNYEIHYNQENNKENEVNLINEKTQNIIQEIKKEEKEQEKSNANICSYNNNNSEEGLIESISYEYIEEEEGYNIENMISNFEICDDMWSVPFTNQDEDELFIF